MSELVEMITSEVDAIRNRSLSSVCERASCEALLEHCRALDRFRRTSVNLYHRVRALFFLAAIHRYHLPLRLPARRDGLIPFDAYRHLLERRFSEAIEALLQCQAKDLPSVGLSSALAEAYRDLGFQTLADQVRRSVRTVRGNQWMFRVGHPADHPLRLRRELSERAALGAPFPVLREFDRSPHGLYAQCLE